MNAVQRRELVALSALTLGLSVLAFALQLADSKPSVGAYDALASTLGFAASGTLSIALSLRGQRRAAGARSRSVPLRMQLLVSFLGSVLAATFWLLAFGLLAFVLAVDGGAAEHEEILALWLIMLLIAQAVSGTTLAVLHAEGAQRERQQVLQIEADAYAARLRALRNQLEPHFLFNGLNTIITLVREDSAAAEEALTNLARILRHSLDTDDASGTVGQELSVVRAELALYRARFEADLSVEIRADEQTLQHPLPPFLLQPLIENAVKHGMNCGKLPLHVSFSLERAGRGISVEIINDGRLDPSSSGIGLRNLRARLELLYPARHRFVLLECDGRVHARLRLET